VISLYYPERSASRFFRCREPHDRKSPPHCLPTAARRSDIVAAAFIAVNFVLVPLLGLKEGAASA
jgi:hypothetical protein